MLYLLLTKAILNSEEDWKINTISNWYRLTKSLKLRRGLKVKQLINEAKTSGQILNSEEDWKSHVTAYARMYLWKLKLRRGLKENSLFTSQKEKRT